MLHIHRWDIGRPLLLVHVLHGMAEHGARYARLAAELNASGMAVWAHDHRGHGLTATSSGDLLGHFADSNGWRVIVDDAWGVSRGMMAAYPGIPIVLFAHSMGSFVGQTLLGKHGSAYRAVVLSGTDGAPDLGEGFLRVASVGQLRILGARNPGRWIDRQITRTFNRRFEPRKTNFDWLSRDAVEVRKYVDDPLCGFPLSSQSWFDFLHGKSKLGSEEQVEKIPRMLPIRLISGTHDPVGKDGEGVQRLLDVYKKKGLTVSSQFYDEARHELVNELNRDVVTRELIDWLLQFVTPSDAATRAV
jgi:alpha-beta hydrolase superfamily lysophospholipase